MKANDLRKGTVIVYNGAPYRVMEFHHNSPGKGQAVVQTKLRNLLNGTQTEVRFNSTESVEEADVFSFKATYLYSDGDGYHFMNSDNYEQFVISSDILGDDIYYLQDNSEVEVTTYNNSVIGVKLPSTVILTVAETEPELKGATASNSPKPARTDTGLSLTVPPFIKEGEKIVVNTQDGSYVSRAD
ncbi:MAG: elongation factor P [Candidatus Dadabacteria bacterium]|nr:MAG: elongation factor P [Candidatus Dadabacteria bacterium]